MNMSHIEAILDKTISVYLREHKNREIWIYPHDHSSDYAVVREYESGDIFFDGTEIQDTGHFVEMLCDFMEQKANSLADKSSRILADRLDVLVNLERIKKECM